MRLTSLGLVLGFVACGGAAPETERTFSGRMVLDQQALQGTYYVDLSVATTPLTADEVNDAARAVPVKLVFLDSALVAFSTRPGSLTDRFMGAWRAGSDRHTNANVTGVGPDNSATTTVRPQDHSVTTGRVDVRPQLNSNIQPQVWVDWTYDLGLSSDELELLTSVHPGCV